MSICKAQAAQPGFVRKHAKADNTGRSHLRDSGGGIVTTFDKREEGFEKKFAHDEELKFKAFARRNKLLGLWAAGLMGKTGADADAYAKEIVMADLAEHGDDNVIAKLKADLGAKASEQQIRAQMSELLATAVAQITKSG
jgi:hypothetical protein